MSRCSTQHGSLRRGKGLTILSPATSECCPFGPCSHYKCHSWERGRFPSSSTCRGISFVIGRTADTPSAPATGCCEPPEFHSRDRSDDTHRSSVHDVAPAALHEESKPPADFGNFNSRQILRKNVRRIISSCNFGHLDASFSNQPESQRSATSMGLILPSPVLWQIDSNTFR